MVNSFIGHIGYIILLLLLSGAWILFIDARNYKKKQMKKEERTGRTLGWVNVTLGIVSLVLNWLMGT